LEKLKIKVKETEELTYVLNNDRYSYTK